MALRSDKEMTAVLGKFMELLGPLDKWSDPALETFRIWLSDTAMDIKCERDARQFKSDEFF